MESYATISSDVRQSIIAVAEPQAVRSLCQTDRQHREFCQKKLTPKDKSKICLDSLGAAQECDLIPMFSQRQFLTLIPKNIEIFADDPVHNTFEFYPQGYKLPSEGFSVALRKAKLMNTICAIVRPDFLLAESTLRLKIPPYIDTELLDAVRKSYATASTQQNPEEGYLQIEILLFDEDSAGSISIHVRYLTETQIDVDGVPSLCLNEKSPSVKNSIAAEAVEDKFLKPIMDDVASDMDNDSTELPDYWSLFLPGESTLNVFRLSRLLKVLFDLGYYQEVKLVIKAGPKYTFNRLL
jgi:hypothetical protein